MRYLAAAVILLSALWVGSGYLRYSESRLGEYAAYLKLLDHVEWALSTRCATVKEWCHGFTDKTLESLGLLPAIRDGAPISEAYEAAEKRGKSSKRAKQILSEYFSQYGRSYLDSELTKLKLTRDALRAEAERDESALSVSVRSFRAVILAVALGAVILLL